MFVFPIVVMFPLFASIVNILSLFTLTLSRILRLQYLHAYFLVIHYHTLPPSLPQHTHRFSNTRLHCHHHRKLCFPEKKNEPISFLRKLAHRPPTMPTPTPIPTTHKHASAGAIRFLFFFFTFLAFITSATATPATLPPPEPYGPIQCLTHHHHSSSSSSSVDRSHSSSPSFTLSSPEKWYNWLQSREWLFFVTWVLLLFDFMSCAMMLWLWMDGVTRGVTWMGSAFSRGRDWRNGSVMRGDHSSSGGSHGSYW